jgi:hypothetical protein
LGDAEPAPWNEQQRAPPLGGRLSRSDHVEPMVRVRAVGHVPFGHDRLRDRRLQGAVDRAGTRPSVEAAPELAHLRRDLGRGRSECGGERREERGEDEGQQTLKAHHDLPSGGCARLLSRAAALLEELSTAQGQLQSRRAGSQPAFAGPQPHDAKLVMLTKLS